MTRQAALKKLLQPIKWDWSSSVEARRNLVMHRHEAVNTVYPFLTKREKDRVKIWQQKEAHDGLWD